MAAIILHETFEVLDLLSHRAAYVALPFGIHVHVWPSDAAELRFRFSQKAAIAKAECEEDQRFPSANALSLRRADAADRRGREC